MRCSPRCGGSGRGWTSSCASSGAARRRQRPRTSTQRALERGHRGRRPARDRHRPDAARGRRVGARQVRDEGAAVHGPRDSARGVAGGRQHDDRPRRRERDARAAPTTSGSRASKSSAATPRCRARLGATAQANGRGELQRRRARAAHGRGAARRGGHADAGRRPSNDEARTVATVALASPPEPRGRPAGGNAGQRQRRRSTPTPRSSSPGTSITCACTHAALSSRTGA